MPILQEPSCLTLTFYPAGHIAGAACIYLESRQGTVFYSGDFCAVPQKTIEGVRIPKLQPDVAIVDTNTTEIFVPEQPRPVSLEQNMALFCIDQTFEDKKHRIYKKSIKSDSVNQIEAFRIITMLCDKYAVKLSQNPSCLPAKKSLRIRVSAGTDGDLLHKIEDEFVEMTGLKCKFL